MATLSVLKDSNSAIHFKQNYLVGWLIAIIGFGLCYLPQVKSVGEGVWLLYCVGGFFAVVGILAAFYRLEIYLDFLQRKYRVLQGFWPTPKQFSGNFDDIEGLWFRKQWKTSSGKNRSKYIVWQTCLKFTRDKHPICLFESRDEFQARENFEKRARQLKVETFDYSGDTVQKSDWRKLDEPVGERLNEIQYQTVSLSNPPSGLLFKKVPDAFSYYLPEPGLNTVSVMGFLFGLPFFLMGVFSTMISVGLHEKIGWNINVSGSMVAAFIFGIIFIVVGSFIFKLSIDYAFTKYRFSFYCDKFSYSTFVYNRMKDEKLFPHNKIEAFDLRESTQRQRRSRFRIGGLEISRYKKSDQQELFIRTHTDVVTLRSLQTEVGQFLRNAFYQNLKRYNLHKVSVSG